MYLSKLAITLPSSTKKVVWNLLVDYIGDTLLNLCSSISDFLTEKGQFVLLGFGFLSRHQSLYHLFDGQSQKDAAVLFPVGVEM